MELEQVDALALVQGEVVYAQVGLVQVLPDFGVETEVHHADAQELGGLGGGVGGLGFGYTGTGLGGLAGGYRLGLGMGLGALHQ